MPSCRPPEAVRLALELMESTSEKYVPAPSATMIQSDQMDMLVKFRADVRAQAERVRARIEEEKEKDAGKEKCFSNTKRRSQQPKNKRRAETSRQSQK